MARHYAPQKRKSKGPAVLVVVLVILLVLGGFCLWWFVLRPRSAQSQGAQQTSSAQVDKAADGDTTKSATDDASSSSAKDKRASTSGDWSDMKPNDRLKAMLDAGEVDSIRLIGDSITAGFGTDGFNSLYETDTHVLIYDDGDEEQYFEPTTKADDWANAFRSYAKSKGVGSFVNAGIGGWFMHDLAENPDAWIREGADVIFVALGTNDAGYFGSSEYGADAKKALEAVAKKCDLVVVVTPVSDRRDPGMLVEPASELGDVLEPLCEKGGYAFVDARSVSKADQFCDDDLHPNSDGSLAIWDCIKKDLDL